MLPSLPGFTFIVSAAYSAATGCPAARVQGRRLPLQQGDFCRRRGVSGRMLNHEPAFFKTQFIMLRQHLPKQEMGVAHQPVGP